MKAGLVVASSPGDTEEADLAAFVEWLVAAMRTKFPTDPVLGFTGLMSAIAVLLARADISDSELDALLALMPVQIKAAVNGNRLLNARPVGGA